MRFSSGSEGEHVSSELPEKTEESISEHSGKKRRTPQDQDKELDPEEVEVNQRHLIDKILARYSAEFTVYRELMQNSDDAGATTVEVDFQRTKTGTKCGCVVYRNNGMPFRDQDWARLRTIAEGNPDEAKIGFFGVGFYSVFSICDEPMIVSGDRILAFTWKGDQLRTTTGDSQEKDTSFTTFVFELRDPTDMPDVDEFGRFLVNSLAFTRNVSLVKITIDGHHVMSLRKTLSAPHEASFFNRKTTGSSLWNMLSGQGSLYSPMKLFELKSADIRHISLEVDYMKDISTDERTNGKLQDSESGDKDLQPLATAKVQIEIGTGRVAVTAGTLAHQMERVTKKRPPQQLNVQVIYSSHTEGVEPLQSEEESRLAAEKEASNSILSAMTDTLMSFWNKPGVIDESQRASKRANSKAAAFFRDFVPYRDKGRVFIGFATHQTTGASFHISCPVIPTVERETIDFIDPVLSQWNQELLYMCGTVARVLYEDEFSHVDIPEGFADKLAATDHPDDATLSMYGHVAHILHTFTTIPSTPHSTVGKLVARGFSHQSMGSPTVLTLQGLVSADKALLPAHNMEQFIKGKMGVVPEHIYKECKKYFDRLQEAKIIRPLYLNDLLSEIYSRPIPVEECARLFNWWSSKMLHTGLDNDRSYTHQMVRSVRLLVDTDSDKSPDGKGASKGSTADSQPLILNSYIYYATAKMIPSNLPLPKTVLPIEITHSMKKNDLQIYGFKELTVIEWVDFVCNNHCYEIEHDIAFAEGVLTVISCYYLSLKPSDQSHMTSRLQLLQCIPTTQGLMLPEAAYFPGVTMFQDLPHFVFAQKNKVNKQLLIGLGVREHVALDMVFERLADLAWDIDKLIRYLVGVQKNLRPEEWDRLKTTPFLPAVNRTDHPRSSNDAPPRYSTVVPGSIESFQSPPAELDSIKKRYRPNELFAPSDNEDLQGLPLPTLQWHGKWREASPEGKLLIELGLMTYPTWVTLRTIASTHDDVKVRSHAMQYLCDNFEKYYSVPYKRSSNQGLRFIPCQVPTQLDFQLVKGEIVSESGEEDYIDMLCLPKECYRVPEARVIGLPVIKKEWLRYAELLGVAMYPAGDILVNFLANNKLTVERARAVFSYCSTCHNELNKGSHYARLAKIAFIPVAKEKSVVWKYPTTVFLGGSSSTSSTFSHIFDFIDFGNECNSFLLACGVKSEPTPVELASALVANPPQVLEAAGGPTGYLAILRECAVRFQSFPSSIKADMARSKCLLGWKRKENQDSKGSEDNDVDEMLEEGEWCLCRPTECSLNDDQILQNVFNPLRAPFEPIIYEMYECLGSKYLSSEVVEKVSFKGNATVSMESNKIKSLIGRRAPLLLYDAGDSGEKKSNMSGKLELLQQLKVLQVDEITIARTFKTMTDHHSPTCCRGTYGSHKEKCILMAKKIDYYDLGGVLARILFEKAKPNQAFLLATFLQTPLSGLKEKGFPVDRLLAKERELVEKRVTEARDSRLKQEHLDRENKSDKLDKERSSQLEEEGTPLDKETLLLYANQLKERFPKKDTQTLIDLLQQEKSNHVGKVTERLLEEEEKLSTHMPTRDINDKTEPSNKPPLSRPFSGSLGASIPTLNKPKNFVKKLFRSNSSKTKSRPSETSHTSQTTPSQTSQMHPGSSGGNPGMGVNVNEWSGQENRMNQLATAISQARKWDHSSSVDAGNVHNDTRNEPQDLPQQEWQCSTNKPTQPLVAVGRVDGIECYVEQGENTTAQFASHHTQAAAFARLLKVLQTVFNVDLGSIHMFYDPPGRSLVAFTVGGSLFFNLRCYIENHHGK
eukprot:Ihof_evm21s3 gene=Ihof_evmTU21s3